MAATLKDLAQYTGYSVGTISNYINGKTPVSKEKQEHIEEAIATLHYKVNFAARMLKTNEYKTIGVLIPDFRNTFLVGAVSFIEEKLNDSGYDMLVLSFNRDPYKEKKMLEYLSQRTDGIIYSPQAHDMNDFIRQIQKYTPIITFNEMNKDLVCDSVAFTNRDITRDAICELFKKGHRHIALIAGPDTSYTATLRTQGYLQAFAQENIALDETLIYKGDYSKTSGGVLCEQILIEHPEATAILVVGFRMTLGVIARLKKMNLSDKISVVGYDASEMEEIVSPTVAYVYQSYQEIAERAVALVLKRVNDDTADFPQCVEIKAELKNIELLPYLNEEAARAMDLSIVPHLIELNRQEKATQGGKLLDEWQRFDQAVDGEKSEEVFFSAQHKTHPTASFVRLPDGQTNTVFDLIQTDRAAFLGHGYKDVALSVMISDIVQRGKIHCHAQVQRSRDIPVTSQGRTSALHVLKTRSIAGGTPYIYLGFKKGITKERWRALYQEQDVEGMLACMHKLPVQEGETYLIATGMPHSVGEGVVYLSVQGQLSGAAFCAEMVEGRQNEWLDAFCYDVYTQEELLYKCKIATFTTIKTPVVTAERILRYTDCKQFRIERYTFSQPITLPNFEGYRVAIAIKGDCGFSAGGTTVLAQQGRGVFIPASLEDLELTPYEGQTIVFLCYPARYN